MSRTRSHVFDDQTIEQLFGADDAENEDETRFKEYFYFNQAYKSIISAMKIRLLVGHKGVGKSALLKRSFLADKDNKLLSVWLKPENLSARRTSKDSTVDFLDRVENWKKALTSSVIESTIYEVYGHGAEAVFENVRDKSLRSQILFLNELLEKRDKEQKYLNVYIDDIDRGWAASQDDIRHISALLNAMRDLSGASDLFRFRIGLRSDVYFLVRTSDESTDKIERNVVWLRWDNNEILRLAAMRISTYFGLGFDQEKLKDYRQIDISKNILSKVIDPVFTTGRGHWASRPIHNVLLSLTRARPRDLVKLFHGAAKKANLANRNIISSQNLEDTFEAYSQERLQDIINEFRSELPDIDKFLLHMRPTKRQAKASESFLFNTDQLSEKIQGVMQHVALRYTNGKVVSPRNIMQFLYKIDFITARKELPDGTIDRKYFDESRFLAPDIVDFGYQWEIHPAYRWALQPQNIDAVFASLSARDSDK